MQVVFFKPSGIIDNLICFFSRGKYSHCAIILDDNSIIEAVPFSPVRHLTNFNFPREKTQEIDIYDINTLYYEDEIVVEFLKRQIGKPYDYWSVFGITWNASNNGRKKFGKWFCSELVFAAFKKVNINLLERIESWKTTPVLLGYSNRLILNKNSKTIKKV